MFSSTHRIFTEAERYAQERSVLLGEAKSLLALKYSGYDENKSEVDLSKAENDALRLLIDRLNSGVPFQRHDWLHFSNSATSRYPLFCYRSLLSIPGFAGCFDAQDAANGLNSYKHIQDLINSKDGVVIALALMRAALHLAIDTRTADAVTSSSIYDHGDVISHGYYLTDDALALMVAENPERVDDIIRAVSDRGGFTSVEAIWEAIDSPSLVLSGGVL